MEPASSPLHSLLEQLLQVLSDERDALRNLRQGEIQAAAAAKLRLDEAIQSEARKNPPTSSQRELLERVHNEAKTNRLLLAHARSCIQGILEQLTGQPLIGRPGSTRAAPRPLALNIRG